jgi:hypothetical protein
LLTRRSSCGPIKNRMIAQPWLLWRVRRAIWALVAEFPDPVWARRLISQPTERMAGSLPLRPSCHSAWAPTATRWRIAHPQGPPPGRRFSSRWPRWCGPYRFGVREGSIDSLAEQWCVRLLALGLVLPTSAVTSGSGRSRFRGGHELGRRVGGPARSLAKASDRCWPLPKLSARSRPVRAPAAEVDSSVAERLHFPRAIIDSSLRSSAPVGRTSPRGQPRVGRLAIVPGGGMRCMPVIESGWSAKIGTTHTLKCACSVHGALPAFLSKSAP